MNATKIDMTIPIRKISLQLESYRNTSQSTIKVSRATKSQDTMPRRRRAARSREADLERLMIDSTIVRAHQHAAGARTEKRGRMPRAWAGLEMG